MYEQPPTSTAFGAELVGWRFIDAARVVTAPPLGVVARDVQIGPQWTGPVAIEIVGPRVGTWQPAPFRLGKMLPGRREQVAIPTASVALRFSLRERVVSVTRAEFERVGDVLVID